MTMDWGIMVMNECLENCTKLLFCGFILAILLQAMKELMLKNQDTGAGLFMGDWMKQQDRK